MGGGGESALHSAEASARAANQAAAVAAMEGERRRRMDEVYRHEVEAGLERTERREWASRQLQQEHLRQEQQRRRAREALHSALADDLFDFVAALERAMVPRRRRRARVVRCLEDLVAQIWPERGRVVLYGSSFTGLDIPSSDVDVVVRGVGGPHDPTPAQGPVTWPNDQSGSGGSTSSGSSAFHHHNKGSLRPNVAPLGGMPPSAAVVQALPVPTPSPVPAPAPPAPQLQQPRPYQPPGRDLAHIGKVAGPYLSAGDNARMFAAGRSSGARAASSYGPISGAEMGAGAGTGGGAEGANDPDCAEACAAALEDVLAAVEAGRAAQGAQSPTQSHQRNTGSSRGMPPPATGGPGGGGVGAAAAAGASGAAGGGGGGGGRAGAAVDMVSSIQRLAAELSACDWVVQVKTIETASIPVIKLLADPKRCSPLPLPARAASSSSSSGSEEHENADGVDDLAAQVAAADDAIVNEGADWGGSCIANGLLAVDVSFAGSDHAGIASSFFVRDLVERRFPEAVPLTLVLKELLVQRHLNEPFSGGLSSYAVLLMAVAVLQMCRAQVPPLTALGNEGGLENSGSSSSSEGPLPSAVAAGTSSATASSSAEPQEPASAGGGATSGDGAEAGAVAAAAGGGGGSQGQSQNAARAAAVAGGRWNPARAFATWKGHSARGISMGALLTRFLAFFGREWDIRRYGLSIARSPPGPFELPPDPLRTGAPDAMMIGSTSPVIEEPITLKNVTRSAFRFEQSIQWLFSNKLTELETQGMALLAKHHASPDGAQRPNVLKTVVVRY